MTNLIRWDPFSDLRTAVRPRSRHGFFQPGILAATSMPRSEFPIDLSETEDDVEVKASLPGVEPSELDVSVKDDVLTIKAEHRDETEEKEREFYRREIRHGAVRRAVKLPVTVDAEKAEASFSNGLLSLRLPKSEALKSKQITISTSS